MGQFEFLDSVRLESKGADVGRTPPPPPFLEESGSRPRHEAKEGWQEERLLDDNGDEIFISYKGKPSLSRYGFIRDYLDFKIKRLKPKIGEAARGHTSEAETD